jgi:hypothetical protein
MMRRGLPPGMLPDSGDPFERYKRVHALFNDTVMRRALEPLEDLADLTPMLLDEQPPELHERR